MEDKRVDNPEENDLTGKVELTKIKKSRRKRRNRGKKKSTKQYLAGLQRGGRTLPGKIPTVSILDLRPKDVEENEELDKLIKWKTKTPEEAERSEEEHYKKMKAKKSKEKSSGSVDLDSLL